jgi:hypothetical protein
MDKFGSYKKHHGFCFDYRNQNVRKFSFSFLFFSFFFFFFVLFFFIIVAVDEVESVNLMSNMIRI